MLASHAVQLGLVGTQRAGIGRPLHLCCWLVSRRWALFQVSCCAAGPCSGSCALSTYWWRACSRRLFRCVDIDPDALLIVPAGQQNKVVPASFKV